MLCHHIKGVSRFQEVCQNMLLLTLNNYSVTSATIFNFIVSSTKANDGPQYVYRLSAAVESTDSTQCALIESAPHTDICDHRQISVYVCACLHAVNASKWSECPLNPQELFVIHKNCCLQIYRDGKSCSSRKQN